MLHIGSACLCYSRAMRRFITITIATLLSFQAVYADAASLMDRTGRWICEPDNPVWPQILIDFEEDAYRRCDQNTCVTYPIVSIVAEGGEVTVRFAPGAVLRTRHQGGPYREQMPVIGSTLVKIGACAFRGTDDVYPLDKVGKSQ